MAAEARFKDRAGRFVAQPQGYTAFIPKPLPPDPPLALDAGLLSLLEEAGGELGRLDGSSRSFPIPTSSSGCTCGARRSSAPRSREPRAPWKTCWSANWTERSDPLSDVGDIVNYVQAMNYGLERLNPPALATPDPRNPQRAAEGGRGSKATPGEFAGHELDWPPGHR